VPAGTTARRHDVGKPEVAVPRGGRVGALRHRVRGGARCRCGRRQGTTCLWEWF
jgi:hypothetical protein